MTNVGKWALCAAILAVVSIASVIATLAIVNRLPPSGLTQDLDGGSWPRNTAVFNARLQRRFPLGTPQKDMISALRHEGFAAEWPWTIGEYEAVRREDTIVCNVAARVYWRIDKAERITSLRGVYREEGCL